MVDKTPNLPNWDSVVELYLKATELYGKGAFTTKKLAAAKLGGDVSAPALDAEATSLYNLLRMGAMYGLVEWYGGEEFAARVVPDSDASEWDDAFYGRAKVLYEAVEKLVNEQKKLKELAKKKIEIMEYKNRSYVVAYIGFATEAEGINGFVFNTWDPQKHAGVVLRALGRNVSHAKEISQKLAASAETLVYTVMGEEVYRGEKGLAADIYLDVKIAGGTGGPKR